MKLWTICFLFLGLSSSLTKCEDGSEGFKTKRFHIQSRQLDGKPHCVETRRKRGTREADYVERITAILAPSGEGEDTRIEQRLNPTDDEDLEDSVGILIIKYDNASPNKHSFYALRQVSETAQEEQEDYSEMSRDVDEPKDFEDSDDSDSDDDQIKEAYLVVFEDVAELIQQNTKKLKQRLSNRNKFDGHLRQKNNSKRRKPGTSAHKRKSARNELRKNYEHFVRNAVRILQNQEENNESKKESEEKCIIVDKEPLESSTETPSGDNLEVSVSKRRRPSNKHYGLRKRFSPQIVEYLV